VRENDPVDRTKTQIKIAEILLEFVGDSIRTNKLEAMHGHLAEYVSAIQDAHAAMKASGRDAYDKPGGFKDLEIALRRHVRQLEDLGGALTWEQRDPVEKARSQATEIRDELIRALFGAQSAATNPS
jgi:hypothetical protein